MDYKPDQTKNEENIDENGRELQNLKEKEIENDENAEKKTETTSKHIRKAVISTFLQNYAIIPISLVMNWFIARALTEELWGIFIHSIILVRSAQLFLSFTPPSIFYVVLYKVPEMLLNKDKSGAKALIQYGIKIKLIFSVIVMIGYIAVCSYLYSINVDPIMMKCIIIYAPFIVIYEITTLLVYYFLAIKRFTVNLYNILMQRLLTMIGFIYLFTLSNVPEDQYIYYMMGIELITTIPLLIWVYYLYHKDMGKVPYEKLSWEQAKSTVNLGMIYALSFNTTNIEDQANYLIIDRFDGNQYKTYFNIPRNFTGQAAYAFGLPIGPVLTEYEQKNKRKEMLQIYIKAQSIMSLILSLISGLLYYFLKVYIILIYTPDYLYITDTIRNYVFIIILLNTLNNFHALMTITKNEKKLMYLNNILMACRIAISFLGYLVFGFMGFIMSQTVGMFFSVIVFWWVFKQPKMNMELPLMQLLKSFISLVIIITVSNLIIKYLTPVDFLASLVQHATEIFANFNVDYSFKFTVIIQSLFELVVFIIVFIAYQLIFFKTIRDDIQTIMNQNIKIPFRKILVKLFRIEDNQTTQQT